MAITKQIESWQKNLLILFLATLVVRGVVGSITVIFVDQLIAGVIADLPVLAIWWFFGDRALPPKYASKSNFYALRFAVATVTALRIGASLLFVTLV